MVLLALVVLNLGDWNHGGGEFGSFRDAGGFATSPAGFVFSLVYVSI